MTVLGSGNDDKEEKKSGDKALLVTENKAGDEVSVLPGRGRLVSFRRRKSLLTIALILGFVAVVITAIFITTCFVKKIGPFKRHYHGTFPVEGLKFNGHHKVFQSYDITDRYALIRVSKFNAKHGTFHSTKTLHLFYKKLTVIQHHNMCFVKPMMEHHMLRNDWYDNLRMLTKHHHLSTPKKISNFHLRIVRPQLPANYLRDEVDHMADTICNNRPVFRVVFWLNPQTHPWVPKCDTKCNDCDASQQLYKWKLIGSRKCKQCVCKDKQSMNKNTPPLTSSTKVDVNCKTIRCENKCANKNLIGCVKCTCVDTEQNKNKKKTFTPLINAIQLDPLIINANDNDNPRVPELADTKQKIRLSPLFKYLNRKNSSKNNCEVVAKIFEGYTPLDREVKVPLDHIYDC